MTELKEPEFIWKYKACMYRAKVGGNTVMLLIYPSAGERYKDGVKFSEWAVTLIISRKRAVKELDFNSFNWDRIENVQTGKGSILGLLYAKNALEHFVKVWLPDYRAGRSGAHTDRVCVKWTDDRRRDIYRRYLGAIGFRDGMTGKDPSPCMYIDIHTKNE